MKRYRYSYRSAIHFTQPVARHVFKLRCLPVGNACQTCVSESLRIYPEPGLVYDLDYFGNRIQYGLILDEHDFFEFTSSGELALSDYFIPEFRRAHPMFAFESKLTGMSASLTDFAHSLGKPLAKGAKAYTIHRKAIQIADAVHSHFKYSPGSTSNETSAAEAFEKAEGVCQDYTHVFIAVCRKLGIKARYVNGFMPGIGYTHAWAEVYDGAGWIGVDPTNNNIIECGYIKIAHGRDASDCPVNRGVYTGVSGQNTEVCVFTEEST